MLPSIGKTAKKNTGFWFLMRNLHISMHCITCFMALDRLSCCKCLLVYVTFYHTHWSVDGPRIAPKVLTEHLDFKNFPGGMPPAPLVCVTSSMAWPVFILVLRPWYTHAWLQLHIAWAKCVLKDRESNTYAGSIYHRRPYTDSTTMLADIIVCTRALSA